MPTSKDLTSAEIATYYRVRVPDLNQAGKQWRGSCPIHNGGRDSFAVSADTGQWKCFSDCNTGGNIVTLEGELSGTVDTKKAWVAVCEIVGRTVRNRPRNVGPLVATYDYTDEDGKLLFQCVRYGAEGYSKDFRQRQPKSDGGWIWNLKGIQLVPYHLPKIKAADTVVLVEGEKDAETLETLGFVASCNPMGAEKWKPDYSPHFTGKHVIIFPDQDEPGRRHAEQVARSLISVSASLRVVNVSSGKDVSDFVAAGGTREQLDALVQESPLLTAADFPPEPLKSSQLSDSEFEVDNEGVWHYVFRKDVLKREQISSRIVLLAFGRQGTLGGFKLVRVHHQFKPAESQEIMLNADDLTGPARSYLGKLARADAYIRPGKETFLLQYLRSTKPEKEVRVVSTVGWTSCCCAYTLPNEYFGKVGDFEIRFDAEMQHHHTAAGTLEDWQEHVSRYCPGNSRLTFAVSCGFAGPLLGLLGDGGGGFHFRGKSSVGKSTALRVAGSVVGGGGRDGYLQSWRTTMNALEGIAKTHNDGLLCLDEIAQCDARSIGEAAYALQNGLGKNRMRSDTTQRPVAEWRLVLLSSGEISLRTHAESADKKIRAGQEIRLIDIPAHASECGLFEDMHGFKIPREFADTLSRNSQKFYGTAFRRWLTLLVEQRDLIIASVQNYRGQFMRTIPADADAEVQRAASFFALVAAAGESATDHSVTKWRLGDASRGTKACFDAWLDSRDTLGGADDEAYVRTVRLFLEQYGDSRFVDLDDTTVTDRNPGRSVNNRAGYRRDGEFLILPETFREVICKGYDYQAVARVLREREYLKSDCRNFHAKRTIPGVGRPRVYVVSASLLESEPRQGNLSLVA